MTKFVRGGIILQITGEIMGYLFLLLALLSGTIKGFCGKKSSGKIQLASDAMIVNTTRMLACILIGFCIILAQGDVKLLAANYQMLLVSALSGITAAAFVVSWLLSVRTGAFMLIEVFLLVGIILPILLCYAFFGEKIGVWQWVGIALLVVSGYVMCTYNTSVKGKMSVKAFLLLLFCTLSYGLSDFSQKLFVKTQQGASVTVFNFYTYVFAAVALIACSLIFRAKEKKTHTLLSPVKIVQPVWGYVAVMSVCLFLNSYFKTLAAGYLSASQIYPLNQGGALVLSMLMSHFLFKEKLNFKAAIGIVGCMAALLLINLL